MKPHPRSYRPDLPMCAQVRTERLLSVDGRPQLTEHATRSLEAWADSMVQEQARRDGHQPAPAPIYRKGPRLDSYRPDLPTFGYSCKQLQQVTAADREYWQAHPLAYDPTSTRPSWPEGSLCPKCGAYAGASR